MSSGAQTIAQDGLPANQAPKSDGFAAAWLGRHAPPTSKVIHMKYASPFIMVLILGSMLGCASLMEDDLNAITAFNPYITKDGKQSFRFVAKNKPPSYYKNSDVQETHETWISNELGKRQYCTKGYEIVSKQNAGDDNLIYEGVCK